MPKTKKQVYPDEISVSKLCDKDINEKIGIQSAYEYEVRNLKTYTMTDTNNLLKEYLRPAGKISINETVSVSNQFTASAGVKASYVEAAMHVTIGQTNTFSINWEKTYTYPVKIKVYPRYEVTTGEVWEDDVWQDDYLGTFTWYRAIGDDVRVYKQ